MNLAGAAKFIALVLVRRPGRQPQAGNGTIEARAEAGAR